MKTKKQQELLNEALSAAADLTHKHNDDGDTFVDHSVAYLRDFSREDGVAYTDKQWEESVDEIIELSEAFD